MSDSNLDQEKARVKEELRVHQQIAFASGLFYGDITIRTLLESLAEGVVIIDSSGTILLVNHYAGQMFGYPEKDLIGRPHAILVPDRLRKVHEEHVARYFAEPKIRPMGVLLDLAGCRRDGSEFPLEISLSFIETINGVLVLAFISDITLRKQMETRLRESEQLFRIQVESVKDYAIFTLDSQGKVLNWNAGAERLKGYRAEEIIGKHFSCFYTEKDRNAGAPEGGLEKAADQGQFAEECWQIRKDGSEFWADVVITPLYDESGNVWGFSTVTHDITDRKKTEEALRKSETKLSKIFHSVPALIGITTVAEGRCIDINEKGLQTLGYRRDEVIGRSTLELGIWESESVRDRAIRILMKEGMVRDLEIYFRGKSGKTFTGILSAELIEFDGEQYMLSVINDITERKRMEEEIVRLNADLEAFNFTVAHDLRQPLNVINSYCQVIEKLCGDQLSDECLGYVQGTYETTLRMDRLIEALLNFSRLVRIEPRRETVNLSAMAHEEAEVLKQTEPGRQVNIEIADGILADGDASLLRAVLDNLLSNAWKYTGMREQAVIEFGARDIDGVPTYFVRDNGVGFKMADADKLFTPFERLPETEKQRGFGIGLSTVERIISRHGGRVWAEGAPGKGACFYFTLATK